MLKAEEKIPVSMKHAQEDLEGGVECMRDYKEGLIGTKNIQKHDSVQSYPGKQCDRQRRMFASEGGRWTKGNEV